MQNGAHEAFSLKIFTTLDKIKLDESATIKSLVTRTQRKGDMDSFAKGLNKQGLVSKACHLRRSIRRATSNNDVHPAIVVKM